MPDDTETARTSLDGWLRASRRNLPDREVEALLREAIAALDPGEQPRRRGRLSKRTPAPAEILANQAREEAEGEAHG